MFTTTGGGAIAAAVAFVFLDVVALAGVVALAEVSFVAALVARLAGVPASLLVAFAAGVTSDAFFPGVAEATEGAEANLAVEEDFGDFAFGVGF